MPQKPLEKDEIIKMRKSCEIAAQVLQYTGKFVKPGISTLELDKIADDKMLSLGAVSACIGYHGYPFSTCISPNQIVCHGPPSAETILKDGDIVNIDVTAKYEGFFGDTSATFLVGDVKPEKKKLVQVAREAMMIGIETITPNGWTGDIGFETDKFVTRKGFSTIKEIGGHGIGRVFHDSPFVPAFGKKGKGERLRPWTCFTVEPMVNEGTDQFVEYDIKGSSIKWYETADGLWSAQFEHTILLTDTGYEILTLID